MPLIASLICNPDTRALTPALANMAAKDLGASGVEWLADSCACEFSLPHGTDRAEAERALRAAIGDQPVDIAVQEARDRRRQMLIADMDSTMIEQECIDELAAELGLKDRVAAITRRAMNGELAFEPALRERVALLENLPLSAIDSVIAGRITLTPGGRELVATMNANGAFTALVSGGFDLFTGPIGATLGFQTQQANRLLVDDGRLTGAVADPILGRAAKAEALRRFAAERGIAHEAVLAVGDGANDLDMLAIAGAGVALHAKPSVAQAARIRIDHGDLTALLYLQGYHESEFVR